MWNEIIYPFPNFNGYTVEVWEWISTIILYILVEEITYPYWDWYQTMFSKRVPSGLVARFRHNMDIVFSSHPYTPQIARFTWPQWGPPRSCRPRRAPCWPHELCYQGIAEVGYNCSSTEVLIHFNLLWHHDLGTVSLLLALCTGTDSGPVVRTVNVFFMHSLNNVLNKHWTVCGLRLRVAHAARYKILKVRRFHDNMRLNFLG